MSKKENLAGYMVKASHICELFPVHFTRQTKLLVIREDRNHDWGDCLLNWHLNVINMITQRPLSGDVAAKKVDCLKRGLY